jgi:alpha-tubulin suppressor-like RCC1 family protein
VSIVMVLIGGCGRLRFDPETTDGAATDGVLDVTPRACVTAIAAGGTHTCAVKDDGSVWCWGDSQFGQVGDGMMVDRLAPVELASFGRVVDIVANTEHTCARTDTGAVYCWGNNPYGQIGDTTITPRPAPTPVVPSESTAIGAGGYQTCARMADATMRCWGYNMYGQIGNGDMVDQHAPVAVVTLTGVAEVAPGGWHSCARLTDGTVSCWGQNTFDQLGDGTAVATRPTPAPVVVLTNVEQVVAGRYHTCALKLDRTVWCWGINASGQLGDNQNEIQSNVPLQVPGLSNVMSLAAGFRDTCARKLDSNVACWGDNAAGQLGLAGTATQYVPAVVSVFAGAVELTGGLSHTCLRRGDGSVWCVGLNDNGQLGNNSMANSLVPVQVFPACP